MKKNNNDQQPVYAGDELARAYEGQDTTFFHKVSWLNAVFPALSCLMWVVPRFAPKGSPPVVLTGAGIAMYVFFALAIVACVITAVGMFKRGPDGLMLAAVIGLAGTVFLGYVYSGKAEHDTKRWEAKKAAERSKRETAVKAKEDERQARHNEKSRVYTDAIKAHEEQQRVKARETRK